MKSFRMTTAAIGIALVTLISACGGSSDPAANGPKDSAPEKEAADPNATLRTTYFTVATLDPAENPSTVATISSTWPVYERLIDLDTEGGYKPVLATEWEFSDDGKALTFQLRKDVVFSDGTPFDADAVKVNIERYKKSDMSKASAEIIDSVEVVNDHEVTLHLAEASRSVLTAMSSAMPGSMVSPKAIESGVDLSTQPVGTGAWVIDTFRPKEMITYKLRPDTENIWDPESGKVAKVEIQTRTSDAAYAALLSGQTDLALSSGDLSKLQSAIDSGQLYVRPGKDNASMVGLLLRQDLKPFDNVKVRQAVNLAIDREAIVKAFVPLTQPRVQTMASSVNGFDPELEKLYPHDPAKAKELLKEAGFPDGVDGGNFYIGNYAPLPLVGQVIKDQLAEAGIRIELDIIEIGQIETEYAKSDRTGALRFMNFVGMEPGANLKFWLENPNFLPGGIPADISEVLSTVDDPTASKEERAKRAREVIKFATENAYYAPLYQGNNGWAVSSKLQGIGTDIGGVTMLGGQDFRHGWVAR